MKPNHNDEPIDDFNHFVVYTMSKIQNETKSQLITKYKSWFNCCLYYVKDTK